MKTKKWLKLTLLTLLSGVILISCSKDEDLVSESDLTLDQSADFVRPDFATLDDRPQNVIAQFLLTGADAVAVKPNENAAKGKYALCVGISNYSGTQYDLEYCDNDADDWYNLLVSEGYTVTLLKDGNATASNIASALTTLASYSTSGSEIVFTYSGHGSSSYSSSMISSDLYYISSSYIANKFSGVASTKMFFTFDACQIGGMKSALNATGRIIAVASNSSTYSFDGTSAMNNGVYTYFQMLGFNNYGYSYVETELNYSDAAYENWVYNNYNYSADASYQDSYSGYFEL